MREKLVVRRRQVVGCRDVAGVENRSTTIRYRTRGGRQVGVEFEGLVRPQRLAVVLQDILRRDGPSHPLPRPAPAMARCRATEGSCRGRNSRRLREDECRRRGAHSGTSAAVEPPCGQTEDGDVRWLDLGLRAQPGCRRANVAEPRSAGCYAGLIGGIAHRPHLPRGHAVGHQHGIAPGVQAVSPCGGAGGMSGAAVEEDDGGRGRRRRAAGAPPELARDGMRGGGTRTADRRNGAAAPRPA